MITQNTREQATPSEALQAILSGLSPLQVQTAILIHSQAKTARQYGFDRYAIARLALRWGILER